MTDSKSSFFIEGPICEWEGRGLFYGGEDSRKQGVEDIREWFKKCLKLSHQFGEKENCPVTLSLVVTGPYKIGKTSVIQQSLWNAAKGIKPGLGDDLSIVTITCRSNVHSVEAVFRELIERYSNDKKLLHILCDSYVSMMSSTDRTTVLEKLVGLLRAVWIVWTKSTDRSVLPPFIVVKANEVKDALDICKLVEDDPLLRIMTPDHFGPIVWELPYEMRTAFIEESFFGHNRFTSTLLCSRPIRIPPLTREETYDLIRGEYEGVNKSVECRKPRYVDTNWHADNENLIMRQVGTHPLLVQKVCLELDKKYLSPRAEPMNFSELLHGCIAELANAIDTHIERIVADIREESGVFYDNLLEWCQGRKPEKRDACQDLADRGVAFYDGNDWVLPERIRRFIGKGGNSMQDQTLYNATIVAIWLWPFFKPGAESFSRKVGDGLGDGFNNAIRGLLSKIRTEDPEKAKQIDKNPQQERETIEELVARIMEEDTQPVNLVEKEVWPALKKLLRNKNAFDPPEVTGILIPDMGYHVQDLQGSNEAFPGVVSNFVNKVRADHKLSDLIREIMDMKPRLFE